MGKTLDRFDEVTRPAERSGDPSLRQLPVVRGMVGRMVAGRFELLDVVAEGGMGTVYRARDHELDDVVALKMLRTDVASGKGALDLFRQEVKLARRVTHRNVARIFELGEHEGRHFLTMEYIQGEPLSATLRTHGRLSANLVVYVLGAVCDALEAAHAVGVVHRDIKPSNVLIASDGRVVLTDFGLARTGYSVEGTSTMGTPAYMAPEQVRGGSISPATDVYSLGAMAYELVTGRKPFQGSTLTEIALARLEGPVPDPRSVAPTVPDSLAEAIVRCMATEPADRFPTTREASKAFLCASPDTQVVPLAPTVHTARITPKQPLLAVIPASTPEQDDDASIAGLVDDLVDALSTVKGLRVMTRTAVSKACAPGADPVEVGKALGTRAVVTVSRREGVSGMLNVSVRLVQSADGVQLWAGRYSKQRASVFEVSEDAARKIAERVSVAPGVQERVTSTDSVVVDLYLRARRCYLRFTFDELGRAIDLFEQARARAPEDPRVCSGLAMALARRWFWDFDGARAWSVRARDAVDTALRVAPWSGEAHMANGTLLLHGGEPAAAARELRRAIACSPSLAEAHESLGRILNEAGFVPEATRRIEAARILDPFSTVPVWELVRNAALAKRWDAFDRHLKEALRPFGKRTGRWTNHLRYAAWKGDRAQLAAVVQDFEQVRRKQSFNFGAVDAYIDVVVRGKPLEAAKRALLDRAFVEGASFRRTTFYLQMLAELAGFAGDADACLQALAKADAHALLDLVWLDHCPLLDLARDTAAFKAVRANVRNRADAVFDAIWA